MGRDGGVQMTNDDALKGEGTVRKTGRSDDRAAELERRTKELEVFRDAGVLTDAELQEQMARVRWRLP
jgi:hypothetical protein